MKGGFIVTTQVFLRFSGLLLSGLATATLIGCGGGGTGSSNLGNPTAAGAGTGVGGMGRGPSPVIMGSAGNFRLLAQTAITNVPTSTIVGDVGLSPATGAGIGLTCVEVTGNIYSVNAAGPGPCVMTNPTMLTTAINDKGTAYTDAAGRAPDYTELGAGLLGGLNFGPGTYKWSSSVLIATQLTLTGGPNDVWIFQIAQNLNLSSGIQILLNGGAKASNVYWQVYAADFGTTSKFVGTIISQTSISVRTGASVNGRLLAGSGITLQSNSVTQ